MDNKTSCKICLKNSKASKWYPNSINQYDVLVNNLINPQAGIKHVTNVRKNICYNLQFLEFYNYQLTSQSLSSVIMGQIYKSFIVFGGSIAEAILFAIIMKNEKQAQTYYREIERGLSNDTVLKDGRKVRYTTIIEEKLKKPLDTIMTLDQMIKMVSSSKLLGNGFDYDQLKKMRRLRNKVHIHSIDEKSSDLDTDYWNFAYSDYVNFKKILKELLQIALKPQLEGEKHLLDWL